MSDMCAPIFPNVEHPAGRTPVHSTPRFPYNNCFHWFGWDLDLEVRVKKGVYDSQDGKENFELSPREYVGLEVHHQDDNIRARAMRAQNKVVESPGYKKIDERGDEEEPDTDVFGLDYDSSRALVPVVDLWLDLPEQLEQEDIPSPMEFLKECRALSQYAVST